MAVRAVLFDMDGTVLDTLTDLAEAVNACFRHFGVPEVPVSLVRAKLGNGAAYLIHACAPAGMEEERIRELIAWYKPYYDAHCRIETRPYPGIPELLPALRRAGFRTAVVSNKADYAVRTLCEHFYPGQFDMILGERPDIPKKPAPDPVFRVLKDLCCSPGDAVYIGDSEVDIETARNAGIPCVSVDWGFRERSLLMQAGGAPIVSSPEELFRLLTGL